MCDDPEKPNYSINNEDTIPGRSNQDLVVYVPKFRAMAMPFSAPLDNLLLEKAFNEKEELIGYHYKGPEPLTVRMP